MSADLAQARIDVAVLKSELSAQKRDIDELKAMVVSLSKQAQSISDTLSEARGGWRALMFMGGAGAAAGGAFVAFLDQLIKFKTGAG